MSGAYRTEVLPCGDGEALDRAARLLRAGELVAIPTETVYGLAANALDTAAVSRIFEVKGRPQDNPLIVHIAETEMWRPLVRKLSDDALKAAEVFWPGPLTIVLPRSELLPDVTTAGLDTVAVRMPAHPGARDLIRRTGRPLAVPSANLSGRPSPTTAAHCLDDLDGSIPLILDGGPCAVGIESTVVSFVGPPVVLRPGAVTAGELAVALGRPVTLSEAVSHPLVEGERPLSPGMKYRHYAPKARLILVAGGREDFARCLRDAPAGAYGLVFEGEETPPGHPSVVYGREHDPESQARGLFAALRELDRRGARLVYARCPDADDEALGVYNRMLRAAAFEVIRV